MNDKEEKKILQHLKQDWQQIDDLGKESFSQVDMENQMQMFQQKKRKAFYIESVFFLLTSLMILSVVTISLFKAPVLFMFIQIVSSLIVPIGVYFTYKKVNRKGALSHDKH
ncbi:YxlC family protein [Alkalihalobacillus macyae]|uniref:YxlC family protein n=1 Tax=Guptibacillus hwajinpoensis TaxID=208199 RepID=UPI00273AADCE|nr:YxlC family protein [Alkalihalobacillus macyae]MDP4549665.1 YxlC family protein [Alkalihalobacillus macyae]